LNAKIRKMQKEDKSVLMKILQNTPEFKIPEVAVAEEVIDSYMHDGKRSGYYVMVVEDDSMVAGYICYGPTPLTDGTWDLYWLVVVREKQGQGLGSTLVKAAEEEIRQLKGRMAIIETSSTPIYEKTRRFHISHGYQLICRVPDFYAPGDDKLILQKLLR
jgi:GNAT superfamily N-acetyltransferase